MTMITFRRTSSTAGQTLTADFDLDQLPAQEARSFHNLINESNFFQIPVVRIEFDAEKDKYEYTITVTAGNSIHTVRVTETNMPRALRPLVEALTEAAEETRNT